MKKTESQHSETPSLHHSKFLVIRGGAIGDFILTLPTLGALRERHPQARIEILGYPHIAELARGRYYADAVRSISYGPMSQFFVPNSILDSDLMGYFGSFDVVISYFFDPDGIFAENLRRCGIKTLLTASAKPINTHAVEHFGLALESLGIELSGLSPKVYFTKEDQVAADRFYRTCNVNPGHSKIAAVHPGSGSDRKNWPLERWIDTVQWLRDEQQCKILLTLGEADDETAAELKPFADIVAENLPLSELAAILARAALYIGNDSGITHLAAASGTPVMALFAVTDPSIWRPRGENVRMIFRAEEWSGSNPCPLGTMVDVPAKLVQRISAEMLNSK